MSCNLLVDFSIFGVIGGGGFGVVLVFMSIMLLMGGMIVGVVIGLLFVFVFVYLFLWWGGLNVDWFLLIGIGVLYFMVFFMIFFLLWLNLWDILKIYIWFFGMMYGWVWE